jgi:hypothetical protein
LAITKPIPEHISCAVDMFQVLIYRIAPMIYNLHHSECGQLSLEILTRDQIIVTGIILHGCEKKDYQGVRFYVYLSVETPMSPERRPTSEPPVAAIRCKLTGTIDRLVANG